jgi:selenocysteine lyase/cysteine desulfurase
MLPVSRRQFLATTALAGAASAARAIPQVQAADALADWAAVRSQFDLAPEFLHLSQFFMVSHPRPVREAIERYRGMLDANPYLAVANGIGSLGWKAQQAAAAYLDGKPEEIALVESTTQGLALLYHGLPLQPGDEVLTTTHDHYVHHESIRLAAQKLGASWRRVPLYARPDAVTVDQVAASLRRAIAPATRVVGLTWVHSGTGVKLPIRALAAVVADANRNRAAKERIVLVVDGVHGFGNQDESPVDMGCDYFVAGTHKWVFAPRGTGIVWAREESWARLRPVIPTFSAAGPYRGWMEDRDPGPTQANFFSPGGFKAYEHQWAMPEAFAFHRAIGRRRVAERTAALSAQCKEGLARMPHVRLHTPRAPELSAGINCFEVAGMAPAAAVQKLLELKVIASPSPYRNSCVRLAPSLVNDEQQVDQALRAVRALA